MKLGTNIKHYQAFVKLYIHLIFTKELVAKKIKKKHRKQAL